MNNKHTSQNIIHKNIIQMSRAKTSTKYYKRNQSNQTKVAHRKKGRSQKKNTEENEKQ
jgi:hypothetical protein